MVIFTSRVHTGVAEVQMVAVVFRIAVDLADELQQALLSQSVFQILADRQREKVGPVQYEGDVRPAELLENAREHQPKPTLTVRHPRQGRILALVLENALRTTTLMLLSRRMISRSGARESPYCNATTATSTAAPRIKSTGNARLFCPR